MSGMYTINMSIVLLFYDILSQDQCTKALTEMKIKSKQPSDKFVLIHMKVHIFEIFSF